MHVNILLFNDFETLDVFGPVQILGRVPEITGKFKKFILKFISLNGGLISSSQNFQILSEQVSPTPKKSTILLIPGGLGTRNLVDDSTFIEYLNNLALNSVYILTVCTGSALLAKTNFLNDKKATTNKRAFNWVKQQNQKVVWIKKSRWIQSDNIFTSSGISAGIDMTLGFIKYLLGEKIAVEVSQSIEYVWQNNNNLDPFATLY